MSNIGVYHSGDAESFRDCLIQSILLQDDEISSDQEHWFGEDSVFDIGEMAEEMRKRIDMSPNELGSVKLRDREFFSHFKRDLTRNRGRTAEDMLRYRSVPKQDHLQKPREVATAFIGTVLRKIVGDLPPGDDATYKVYFTQPAGEKSSSRKYRETIRKKIIPKLEKGLDELGVSVDFPDKNSIFEYESYVAYQYALRDQNLGEGFTEGDRPSFLIVDIGGSTTDATFVQAKLGSKDSPYPVSNSIRYAGDDYDKILLREINDQSDNPYSEKEIHDRKAKSLRKVKEGKEKASRGNAPVTIEIGQREFTIGETSMLEAFDEWWTHIEDTLIDCIESANERAEKENDKKILEFENIDSVFLVGGGSQLSVDKENLTKEYVSTQFDSISEEVVVTPSDLDVDASLTASLGHAAMVRDSDSATGLGSQRQQTNVIEGRFKDDNGRILRFQRKEREPGEFSMADSELRNSPVAEGAVNLFDAEFDLEDGDGTTLNWDDFSGVNIPDEDKPNKVNMEVKSRAQTEWVSVGEIDIEEPEEDELRHRMKIIHPDLRNGNVKYRHMSSIGERSRFTDDVNDNTVLDIVKDREEHPKVELPLSKKYKYSDEEILVFFDLGMNNTSVSIYDPLGNIESENFEHVDIDPMDIEDDDPDDDPSEDNKGDNDSDDIEGESDTEEDDGDLGSESGTVEETNIKERIVVEMNARGDLGHKSPERYANDDGTIRDVFSFKSFRYFVLKEKEYEYPEDVLRAVWTSATSQSRRLTILTGPPGMGKTSLIGLLAEFFNLHSQISDVEETHNEESLTSDGDQKVRNAPRLGEKARELYYRLVPVSPSWLSPDDLLGRYDQIEGSFRATDFLRFCLYADSVYNSCDRDFGVARRFFACLDEFNIAHPEKYLSSLLSLMEEDYGSPNSSKELYRYGENNDKRLSIRIPHNLNIFGTINSDYTTKDISPKVHDRSITVRLSPEFKLIQDHAKKIKDEKEMVDEKNEIIEYIFEDGGGKLLEELQDIGYKCGRPISFRTVESIIEYVCNMPKTYTQSENQDKVVSDLIKRFFLSKLPEARTIDISGYEEELSKVVSDDDEYSSLSSLPGIEKVVSSIKDGNKGIRSI